MGSSCVRVHISKKGLRVCLLRVKEILFFDEKISFFLEKKRETEKGKEERGGILTIYHKKLQKNPSPFPRKTHTLIKIRGKNRGNVFFLFSNKCFFFEKGAA